MSGNPQPDSQKESQAHHHSREMTSHAISSASPVKGGDQPCPQGAGKQMAQRTCRGSSVKLSTLLEWSHHATITVSVSHCGARLEQCQGCIWDLHSSPASGLKCDTVQNEAFAPLRHYYHRQKSYGMGSMKNKHTPPLYS